MLFNSVEFAVFLPIVFLLYCLCQKKLKLQNALIVVVSYIFYSFWDWRFLFLIIISSITDYVVGLLMYQSERKKLYLGLSLLINLGFLGVFKYYNFFIESFISMVNVFGFQPSTSTLRLILPAGISFYTFQTLSYTIDIYQGKLKPTKDILSFFAFVSFFPQLVAGPIERAGTLLPQFQSERKITAKRISSGLKLMLLGFFLKLVLANRLGTYVDLIYDGNTIMYQNTATFSLAALFFAFQIYGDFAGYSYIAIGCAKLFGFDLMHNFNKPYLAASYSSYWARWHISLYTWFRDYIYFPLGGSKKKPITTYRNIMAIFVISGLWHGANWTFVVWGFMHGFFTSLERAFRKVRLPKVAAWPITFVLLSLTHIFFRSKDLPEAIYIIKTIFLMENFRISVGQVSLYFGLFSIVFLMITEVISERPFRIKLLYNTNPLIRYLSIITLIVLILGLGVFDESQFIYFQF